MENFNIAEHRNNIRRIGLILGVMPLMEAVDDLIKWREEINQSLYELKHESELLEQDLRLIENKWKR